MSWDTFWVNLFYASLSLLILVVIGVGVIQFAYYRNLNRKKKFYANLQGSIKKGDKITFSNGLLGTILSIDGDTADIEIKSGAVITISRFVIASIENN